jgi:hypothetical protein
MKNKPDFLIIGPPKTATTSLSTCLRSHSKIFQSRVKEVHFFDVDQNFEKGTDWYSSRFSDKGNGNLIFEATPNYFSDFKSLIRIADTLKSIKLICILRDPVDRLISQYLHFRAVNKIKTDEKIRTKFINEIPWDADFLDRVPRWQGEPRQMEDIVSEQFKNESMRNDYFLQGEYIVFIKFIFSLFGKQLLKIIIFDELISKPQETITSILSFLELEFEQLDFKKQNTTDLWVNYYDAFPEIHKNHIDIITQHFKPYNSALENLLRKKLNWK